MISLKITAALLILLLIIKLTDKSLSYFGHSIDENYVISRLKLNAVSIDFLSSISEKYFHNYVISFIKEKFKNNEVTNFSQSKDSSVTHVLNSKSGNYTYLGIKKIVLENHEFSTFNDSNSINEDYIYKFIGTMAHDNVKRGIIITNGNLNPNAKKILKSLSPTMRIVSINGLSLTKLIWKEGCK